MKYPQLVSPRAVNAISDWLVSRLEQLGVESPQIYTRLLLSLLQSSVQVNDPIEFSNLEAFFANYKGGHSKRFHLPSDTETLKKLNAVQCLREIVSNDCETAAIELLVNELRDKLKDIEQRSQDLNIAEGFLIDTHLNSKILPSAGIGEEHQQGVLLQQQSHLYRNTHFITANESVRLLPSSENALKDLDNDPKKRYFRAFPALTKEMEDSFRIWRRNAKSLTWPVVGRSIGAENSLSSHSISANSSLSSTNFENSIKSDTVLEKKLKEDHLEEDQSVLDCVGNSSITVGELQVAEASSVSSKKKSKRRRNQALSKGKTAQNLRKVTLGNSCSSNTTTPGGLGGGKFYNQNQYRNTASPTWDTDFKGCWEMGPDLIKEFLARQKIATKRSRSNSDSMELMERNVESSDGGNEASTLEEFYPGKARPAMKRFLDISFGCDEEYRRRYENEKYGVDYVDEDYDDDNTLDAAVPAYSNAGNPRRLYQREGILQKPLVICGVVNDQPFKENPVADEQRDFASFKAKFNSSVEALWKDVDPQADVAAGKENANGISSAFYATTSLNALAPFKHDLWNFWSNYNQHHYDPAATSSMITTGLDDSSASSGAGAGADIANSSDYFSMPNNLDDFDKSVGAVRRQNEAGASLGAHTPSINVFLQNSIWSSSGDCVDAVGLAAPAGETDESFLYKVWHSNKKLSQIDMGNKKDEMIPSIYRDAEELVGYNKPKENLMGSVSGNGANLEFPPYSSLKWSEGINAGPPYINLRQHNPTGDFGGESLHMGENKFASFGSAATVTGANWDAPVYGQNVQPDLKSWCASNPLSLTEMYGSDVCDSITQDTRSEADKKFGPPVTLPNHSATSSGFVAYARIKQCGIIKPQIKPLPQPSSANASRLAMDYFRVGEDENLLTSEKTHFHPIENFVDGHTFSISSALDVVEFDRSASGYMCYNSNEYMEYTRNDTYLADEEVATNSNLIGYAATASCQTQDSQGLEENGLKEMFVLKFRLKRSGEMACQTEEVDFQIAAAKMAERSHSVERPEMPMFFNNDLTTATQTNKDVIIAAVTKAVAVAAKVAAQRGFDSGSSSLPWVPVTAPQHQPWMEYPSLCDEVDSCINKADTEQLNHCWSMHAVEKQCHQRRLPTNEYGRVVDIDKSDENSIDSSLHTLWGMCAVCDSCDYGKSMPANSLLRDELNLEADEIMSDLRFMQDLYIGEAAECCSEIADLDRKDDVPKLGSNQEVSLMDGKDLTTVDHVQASMLLKCNQLIEDLLKPEQTGKLMKITCENETEEEVENPRGEDVTMTNVWSLNNDDNDLKGNAHSWHYGNDHMANIWQHEPDNARKNESENEMGERKNACIKPMKLLRQVGGSLSEEDNMYMDILDWEHDHLAKIWQQSDYNPPPGAIGLMPTEKAHIEDPETSFSTECQKIVEKKNLKNLQCITRSTPPSANALDAATFKRVQQFLNTSSAKMKLAANRKRRHSASQNFYHQQQQQLNTTNNNNNNDKISDMNCYKQKLANTAAAEEMQPPVQEPKQTFITCKYWTTTTNGTQASLESAAAAMMLLAAATNSKTDGFIGTANYEDTNDEGVMLEENAFGNNFSCLIDKNASLFKHVAMMARPLTR